MSICPSDPDETAERMRLPAIMATFLSAQQGRFSTERVNSRIQPIDLPRCPVTIRLLACWPGAQPGRSFLR